MAIITVMTLIEFPGGAVTVQIFHVCRLHFATLKPPVSWFVGPPQFIMATRDGLHKTSESCSSSEYYESF